MAIPVLCTDGQLRLVGGTSNTEGRVEICINETWGTICDDGWTGIDAQVACRSLGFSYMGILDQLLYYTLIIVFVPLYRSNGCQSCSLWPGSWSNSPG